MRLRFLIIFISTIIICDGDVSAKEVPVDIYWRDYTGVVPLDAVPGGTDVDGKTTYIGQGPVKDRGIIPGVIYDGKNEMTVPMAGTKVVRSFIKILCSGTPEAFRWVPVKADELHLKAIHMYLVGGGVEFKDDRESVYYIGRVAHQGQVITGKIFNEPQRSRMYFVHKNKELHVDAYEVLTYETSYRIDIK